VPAALPPLEVTTKRICAELLPRFSNVDGVVPLTHTYGCGVAINAPGAAVPIRTLRNIARNPNFGGVDMVVGLGREKMLPEWLLSEDRPAPAPGNTDTIVRLQDESQRGFGDIIAAILDMAEKRLEVLNRRSRTTCPAADLMVGMQCGGSDAFSGVTANPAVGFASDLLVRAGAAVMFSEVTEVRDAVHMLTPRAADEAVARALVRETARYDDYLQEGASDRSANTTPASDFICGTSQFASGMTMHVLTTGRGTPYGLAAVPVIKMAMRKALSERWHDLIDIDAGRIATGEATIEQVGSELFQLILDVASGRKQTWADHWGLHNAPTLFTPGPVT